MQADAETESEDASEDEFTVPIAKRRKIQANEEHHLNTESASQDRAISPPPLKRRSSQTDLSPLPLESAAPTVRVTSPIKLTKIRDLPDALNADTITLHDLVGDASIVELWHFNYLFDIDFVMSAMHKDTRNNIPVNIVHGFSGHREATRLALLEAAENYPNVRLITAGKIPTYGTHHSKMMIVFRSDETAEIVIHTANMICRDWTNLTQAVWKSERLPLQPQNLPHTVSCTIGSGDCFKNDLLAYLTFYEGRTVQLVTKLMQYDFSTVRAALVASVPKDVKLHSDRSNLNASTYGWPRLKQVLKEVPVPPTERGIFVAQISSIATLGKDNAWLAIFRRTLQGAQAPVLAQASALRLVFPIAEEIRRSLDGYESGASIHTKTQSTAQKKQLDYLRPHLCTWAGATKDESADTGTSNHTSNYPGLRLAGRRRAAPHIKTYIRFTDPSMTRIDWAMLTSANLSVQAWGGIPKESSVTICSYEIGVVIWPELFVKEIERVRGSEEQDNEPGGHTAGAAQLLEAISTKASCTSAVIVPTFLTDTPTPDQGRNEMVVVGFRMPYDLPLVRYGPDDVPWCASSDHLQPDWKGQIWKHN